MRRGSPFLIVFASGAAGLGYELTWTRLFAVGLGHELPSVLAVLVAFFGGLALGAFALDGIIARSNVPGRWYAACEAVIGFWGLATLAIIPALNRSTAEWIGLDPTPLRHWMIAFAVPFLALLPATIALGASFPAIERMTSRLYESGRTVAGLYAANTAGALLGTAAVTFLVMPRFGLETTVLILAAVNFTCAFATLFGPAAGERARPNVSHGFTDAPKQSALGWLAFATGFLGIGFQVVCLRVMAQALENTVYSFASSLMAFLLGTAGGAFLYQRRGRAREFQPLLGTALYVLGLSTALTTLILVKSREVYETASLALGASAAAAIGAELVLAFSVFFVPTLVMGATFSHLVLAARSDRGGIGRAQGLNTLGAAVAPVVFGVVLFPVIGAKWSLLAVASGYWALLVALALPAKRLRVPFAIGAVLAVVISPERIRLLDDMGGVVLAHRDGVMATVSVIETSNGARTLKVNDRFTMGGTTHQFSERRQAHLALLLHPKPETALLLGLGAGVTAHAASQHPGLDVTAVELLPEVVELASHFRFDEPARAQLNVKTADARRFVQATAQHFDVIVADLFHPARDGAGMLYTVEHFAAVKHRLSENGLFVQWLPLHQLGLETLRTIVGSFADVFPHTFALMAHFNVETPLLGLVGSAKQPAYGVNWLEQRVRDPALRQTLERVALSRDLDLWGCFVGDDRDLRDFAAGAPLNSDLHPRVIFEAPRFTYEANEPRYARMLHLVKIWRAPLAAYFESVPATERRAFIERTERYLEARNLFLLAAVERTRSADSKASLALLLESVQKSADFTVAYVNALGSALDLARTDPETARSVLQALMRAVPADPRAAEHYVRLFGG